MRLYDNRRFLFRWLLPAGVLCGMSGLAQAVEFVELLRLSGHHPSVLAAESSAEAARFDIDQAQATNSLKVSAGLASTAYSSYSEELGYENSALSPQVGASKVIYDHGRAEAMVDGRQAAYELRRAQVEIARENIDRQILHYYTTAVSDAKVGSVLDEQVRVLSGLRDKIRTIASIDSGRAFEVSQVETRLNSTIASRVAREASRQQAWQQLTQMLQADVALTHELPDLSGLAILPDTLAEAENQIIESPQFISARHQHAEAEAAVRLASKWNRPRWTLQLSADSPRQNGSMHLFKAATLQLSVETDLFDGGSGKAALGGETMRLAAAEREIDATRRGILQELRQLWVSLPLRGQQISALAAQNQVARQTLDAGETQFLAGRRPLTDLISFVSDYYSGLASYEDQRVQYVATQWQILSALGRLGRTADEYPSLSAPRLGTPPGKPVTGTGAMGAMRPGKAVVPLSAAKPADVPVAGATAMAAQYAPQPQEQDRRDLGPQPAGQSVPRNTRPETGTVITPPAPSSTARKEAYHAEPAQPAQQAKEGAGQKVLPDDEHELRKWPWK